MKQKMILWLWLRYYTALYCVRLYIWNVFVSRGNRAFENADLVVRTWVGKRLQ